MKSFILKSKMIMRQETLDQARKRFISQLNNDGIVVIGPEFEIIPIPGEWIKCEVIKPKPYAEIIFCDKNKIEYIGTINNFNQFVDRSGEVIEDVVAWMPSPIPFEE